MSLEVMTVTSEVVSWMDCGVLLAEITVISPMSSEALRFVKSRVAVMRLSCLMCMVYPCFDYFKLYV